ncbi:MAG: ABC transporter ATP-binding protein [Microbacter sp.]
MTRVPSVPEQPIEERTHYRLNLSADQLEPDQKGTFVTFRRLLSLLDAERRNLYIALLFILINSGLTLISPYLIGHAVDRYVVTKHYDGVIRYAVLLAVIFVTAFFSGYAQAQLMGRVGQKMLFSLRNRLFNKLQELPIEFFHQNKAGDLISRLNNDTDKINQFFSQSFVQFMSSIFTMIGAAVFLISIDWRLGLAALSPAVVLWIYTRSFSHWVKQRNKEALKTTGLLSAEVQESLQNFKVIVAFNRRDYFQQRFNEVNRENYRKTVKSGIANTIFTPVYTLFSNIGQLIVLAFGIYLITEGEFSVGLLISFLAYVTQFYNPLRQLAVLWANFQTALAGWDRISQIFRLESNLPLFPTAKPEDACCLLSFRHVSFSYPDGDEVLHDVSFDLKRGKTYAFVGPTGGGKTTTASLIARLYDPSEGTIFYDGVDLRTMNDAERSRKIGVILQDPILFTGTLKENILYGNALYHDLSDAELLDLLRRDGLSELMNRFEKGLETPIQSSGESISLGQKQLIAFIRVALRQPELLILDEATANIDTVTEQLLETILRKLPETTTRIVIAHRLNTIENADEIFFVNSGSVIKAGSMDDAVRLLMQGNRKS